MQIFQWLGWFNNLKIEKKWFVVVMLLRPVLEGLFFLKEVSIVLSPLYLLGIGVPIAVLLSIFTRYKKKAKEVGGVDAFRLFSYFTVISCALLIVRSGVGISTIQAVLRVSLIIFIFSYSARYFLNIRDVEGLLITFLISSLYPLMMMMYEILVNPISIEMSRSLERIRGLYADSFNYSIYITMSTIAVMYFQDKWKWMNYRIVLPLLVVAVLGLYHLNHIASWAAFMAIMAVRIASSPRRLIIVFAAALVFIPILMNQQVDLDVMYDSKLVGKEYEILLGERPVEQAFHGRMTRWEYYAKLIDDAAPQVWVLGIFSDLDLYPEVGYVLVAPHNDFLRIFLLSGLLGLTGYLVFLLSSMKKAWEMPRGPRFLKYSVVVLLMMYSVSAIPSIYPSLISIAIPVLVAYDFKEGGDSSANDLVLKA
ncbi:MAG: hypothetical protein IH600_12640 [Bacteroidetes bacterium]|nr:hypothetical protein [Bacteroidota bacterium]